MNEKTHIVNFSTASAPTLRAFLNDDTFLRGLMGPVGSGKSSACVMEIIRRALAQKKNAQGKRVTRWAVIRNTYPQLRDTSLKTFLHWFPEHLFGRWRETSHSYFITSFPDTEIEVLFRALDRPEHVSNLLSLELTGAWVNEAREVPWPIIQVLQSRVGRFPAVRDGGVTWSGIFMDTNPPDTESWWHRIFEETKAKNAKLFRQPSGRSEHAENVANLPAKYYANLAQNLDEQAQRVYIDGEYGFLIEGTPVFSDYHDNLHCRQTDPIPHCKIYRGWDFGLTPACVFSQVSPSGHWPVFDELIAEEMGIDRFSDQVLLHCSQNYPAFTFADIGDPAGASRAQTDEKSCFDILRAKRIMIEAGQQTLTIRLESVRRALRSLVSGEPIFRLSPRCKFLRKGFNGAYHYRKIHGATERLTDEPEKNHPYSDLHDALQYVGAHIFGTALQMPAALTVPDRYRREQKQRGTPWSI